VDFDALRQELSDHIVDGSRERFQLDWPGKCEAMALASAPIAKTLRPYPDESVRFENTENLFVEGDNLEALKTLQTSMLGKVRMIYIDPPYNTGNDFVYDDDFSESAISYFEKSNQTSDAGDRLVANTESNGRFHSDWLTMLYPRLKVARTLLADDGVMLISIDEGEKANLSRMCNEIFGEENYRNTILVRRRVKSLNSQFADDGLYSMNVGFEYVLIYAKSRSFLMNALRMKKKSASTKGTWNVFWSGADRPTMRYELLGFTPETGQWRWSREKALVGVSNYETYLEEFSDKMSLEDYWRQTGEKLKFVRRIDNGTGKNGGVQYWIAPSDTALRSSNWTDIEVSQIRKDYELPFENPKSIDLIMELIRLVDDKDFTILDFFAGSATTADATLRLNAEDGGRRRFVMVQIPEATPEGSVAREAGFASLTDISKERIRLAGMRLNEDETHPDWNRDVGFRVLKVDTSNMKDVYYRPDELNQADLLDMVDNVKPDRTPEDLLFQVLVDWGVNLTLPIRREEVMGKTVFFVDDNALIACFDKGITEEMVKTLAGHEPLRVVFRDNGFVSDAVKINVEQIFRQLSPTTDVKSI
jgi:adenine-specific DNA-methyltransferase